VHVQPLSGNKQSLTLNKQWWLQKQPLGAGASVEPANLVTVIECKAHGDSLIALFDNFQTPEQAQALRHVEVLLPRSAFAKPGINEYYWVDLIGCQVVNKEGELLGTIGQMDDHGAHSIMVVISATREEPHLIPFVSAYVGDVSLADRKVMVDWQNDY
jgi:16S rRNA processing protein RimM